MTQTPPSWSQTAPPPDGDALIKLYPSCPTRKKHCSMFRSFVEAGGGGGGVLTPVSHTDTGPLTELWGELGTAAPALPLVFNSQLDRFTRTEMLMRCFFVVFKRMDISCSIVLTGTRPAPNAFSHTVNSSDMVLVPNHEILPACHRDRTRKETGRPAGASV